MLIYFAAPLFCQAERTFNAQLTKKLEDCGFRVFLPQRDGIETSFPPDKKTTIEEWHQIIFTKDRDKILEADIFLFVLDGRVPDEGACVELGIAYSQKYLLGREKLLIGLQTDRRAAFPGSKLNAMIRVPLEYVVDEENDLLTALEAYRS
jgi:nucleoside 2-deoxyribosyltransferase